MNINDNSLTIITKYFSELTEVQKNQFQMLDALYHDWNAKINVISRKDIDCLYEHHILHSLAIAKVISFREGTSILDLGTGGGFPGIPLAILFPKCNFCLVDSIGKKIRVATEVSQAIGLTNVTLKHENAKEEKGTFDFCVSRAVMNTTDLIKIIQKKIRKEQRNALPNGLICLKGGDTEQEMQEIKRKVVEWKLSEFFHEAFFETKKIIYVPLV
ncbi:MAG: 16S rRNA (guanine(527)-N(7))-methyltransferase RsmG [Bacteroidaceae bacterium]